MTSDEPRVLYIDGDPVVRELVSRSFGRRPGVAAWAALDGAMGLAALEATRFDCVVARADLPQMTGLELLDEIRASHAELPFVLFAADGDERLASEALGRGATDYLRRSGTNPVSLMVDRAAGYAERHYERAALERVRERYELAGRVVSDVVWERDLDDGTVRWGAGVEAALGYDRDGSYDREWWLERVHPEDRVAVREAWAPVEAGDAETFECRYRFRRADDSYAQVVDEAELVRDGGTPTRLVGALRDVSDRLARAAELEERNEQLDEFATVVSHDLRNPLTVARGRIELARESGSDDDLAAAVTALDRMDDLIEDLLALAREGQAVDEPEPVGLGEVAEAAWRTIPDRSGATLAVETDCQLLADRKRLRQLLENLLANAVEHGGNAPTVSVGRLDGAPDGFYVADDGPGIRADERDAVFDRSYTDGSDTGIGLPIVAEIVDAHGWDVDVTDSERDGARFEIRNVTLIEDDGGAAARGDGDDDPDAHDPAS